MRLCQITRFVEILNTGLYELNCIGTILRAIQLHIYNKIKGKLKIPSHRASKK